MGLAGLVVGIAGLVLSAYFYSLTIKERSPVFEISSERALVANTKHSDNSKIKVIRSDGQKVEGEIWTVRFYFWNTGRVPVRSSEILLPLTLKFSDPNIEILDFAILAESRPMITQAKLTPSPGKKTHSIGLNFNILEEKDVIEGQITYVGDEEANLAITGSIEGVQNIASEAPVNWVSVWANFFTYSGYLLVFVCILFVIDLIEKMIKSAVSRLFPKKLDKIRPMVARVFAMAPKIIFAIGIIGVIYFFAYISATPKASSELKEKNKVSENFRLKPEQPETGQD